MAPLVGFIGRCSGFPSGLFNAIKWFISTRSTIMQKKTMAIHGTVQALPICFGLFDL